MVGTRIWGRGEQGGAVLMGATFRIRKTKRVLVMAATACMYLKPLNFTPKHG